MSKKRWRKHISFCVERFIIGKEMVSPLECINCTDVLPSMYLVLNTTKIPQNALQRVRFDVYLSRVIVVFYFIRHMNNKLIRKLLGMPVFQYTM